MKPLPFLLSLSLAPVLALASLPAPVVETFDSLPESLSTKWTPGPTTWTSSVSVVSLSPVEPLATNGTLETLAPIVWTAANARLDSLSDPANPALGLQASSDKKGWLSATIPISCQRLSFSRMTKSKGTNAFDVYVNTVCIATNVRTADTNEVWQFETETLPFEAPISILVSNRIVGANVAIDGLTITPFTLFVTLDRPPTNSITVQSEEFTTVEKEFNVVATHNLPPDSPANAVVTGSWTVTPDFSGFMSDLDAPHLTLVPTSADAGKTFTLSYTATIAIPPSESGDSSAPVESVDSAETAETIDPLEPVASFSHTASCTLEVTLAPVPRFLDFEDLVSSFGYNTDGGHLVSISDGNFLLQNIMTSDERDPKIGNRSLRVRHLTAARPAFFASEDGYPYGIGTVSFRYANFSAAAANSTMTLVVQVHGEDDEDWTDLPDGTLVVTNHYSIDDFEFRVNVDRQDKTWFRLLSTAGAYNSLANIDNLHIRPFGSNAPVLLFRGSSWLPSDTPWSAFFCYTNPAPGVPYDWSWSLSDPENLDFLGLSCTTNDAGNRLEFASASPSFSTFATNVLTVSVSVGGVVDQQLSVPLVVAPPLPPPPSFDLFSVFDPCTNIVDVFTTNVVLYDGSTNFSVVWTAEPPFNGTNTVHNKSRYRVTNIVQNATTEHLLTAVLTDNSTPYQLTSTNTLLVTVLPSDGSDPDDPPPVAPSTPSLIIAFSADSLTVSNLVPGAAYTPFALTNLLSTNSIPVGPSSPASDTILVLPLTNLPSSSPLFLGVFHTP